MLEDATEEKREPRVQSPVRNKSRYEDILMPGITPPHDERHPTPERSQASARPTPLDASIPAPKMRRLDPDNPMDGEGDDNGSDLSIDQIEERKILGMLLQGVDITEVFSPERVAKIGANYKLIAGKSMDLTNGYDFSLEADQKRAWEHIVNDEPYCVIGSPPCTLFSLLMELNIAKFRDDKTWMEKYEAAKAQAVKHIEFCCKIYKHQLRHKRHYIH